MKLLNKNILKPYVLSKKFGPYYLPVKFQNKILKQYCDEKNKVFNLSSGEITFGNSYIQLRSMISNIKSGEGLLFLSVHVLPKDKEMFKLVIDKLKKKKVECHFVFEEIIVKNNADLKKITNYFKFKNFTNQT
tara:strand:+ start:325 stop:723 length:399 start_codon:yes stop_codon:yes gene_type:complete